MKLYCALLIGFSLEILAANLRVHAVFEHVPYFDLNAVATTHCEINYQLQKAITSKKLNGEL